MERDAFRRAVDQSDNLGYESAISFKNGDNGSIPNYKPWADPLEVKVNKVTALNPRFVLRNDKLMGADVAVKSGRLDGLPDSKEKLLDPQLQLGDFVLLENTTLTTSTELLTDKSFLAVTDAEISSGLAAARGKGYDDLLDFHQQALHESVLGRLSAARSKWSNDTFEVTKRSAFMASIAAKALRAKKHGGGKVAVTWILEDWNELKFQGKLADAKIMTQ